MCRIAAFPPGFERAKAIELLTNFERNNTDGTGYSYIKNGEFKTFKSPKALSVLLSHKKKSKAFLNHMPHDGWTICHLRAASHGEKHVNNTHPFIVGDYSFIHNGIWSEYNVVKLALKKTINFTGETDSEVAAHLFNIAGIEDFTQEIDRGGVFMALNKDGKLYISMTSGELAYFKLSDNKYLIASDISFNSEFQPSKPFQDGWFIFNENGTYNKMKKKKSRYSYFSSVNDDDDDDDDDDEEDTDEKNFNSWDYVSPSKVYSPSNKSQSYFSRAPFSYSTPGKGYGGYFNY